jgi:hypothetical protein
LYRYAKAEAAQQKLQALLDAGVSLAEAFPPPPPPPPPVVSHPTKKKKQLSFLFPGGSLSTAGGGLENCC